MRKAACMKKVCGFYPIGEILRELYGGMPAAGSGEAEKAEAEAGAAGTASRAPGLPEGMTENDV